MIFLKLKFLNNIKTFDTFLFWLCKLNLTISSKGEMKNHTKQYIEIRLIHKTLNQLLFVDI